MDVSAVILTWNSEKYIAKCLISLLSNLSEFNFEYEIFIVDNGSKDGTNSILNKFSEDHPKRIFPIRLDKNRGTTYPRNIALKKASGKFILVIDSDVDMPETGVIRHLLETIGGVERAGLIAPRLNYPDGRLQKSTDYFPTLWTKFLRYFFLKSIETRENFQKHKRCLQKVDYAISAFWLMKRDVVEDVGWLDENIFYAPEDVDYCLRIWKAGYEVLYDPTISAIHDTQEISRGMRISKATISHLKGLIYFFLKHRYIVKRPLFN